MKWIFPLFIPNYKYRNFTIYKNKSERYRHTIPIFFRLIPTSQEEEYFLIIRVNWASDLLIFIFVAAFVALLSFAIFKQHTRAPVFCDFELLTLEEATKWVAFNQKRSNAFKCFICMNYCCYKIGITSIKLLELYRDWNRFLFNNFIIQIQFLMKTFFYYFFNLLIFSIADYVPIIYNILDCTICNIVTQSELSHIPAEFAMQNLEGNA